MTYPTNTTPAPALTFDSEPIATRLSFDYNEPTNKKEDTPMKKLTLEELIRSMQQSGDEYPEEMTVARAKQLISYLDPANVPANIDPKAFAALWNVLLKTDPPEDLWSPADQ